MDYMNVAQVHEMIGHGFQLGLHGHQHKSSTMTTVAHLDRVRTMAIVSAGSLCASDPGVCPEGLIVNTTSW